MNISSMSQRIQFMSKIKVNQLADTVADILSFYSDEVIRIQKDTVDEISKETRKIVKRHAPVGRRGKYRKSIKVKTVYESITEKRNVIHVEKPEYRLTHLLEKGHKKRGGKGKTKPIPHFIHGQDYIEQNYENRIKKKIQGG